MRVEKIAPCVCIDHKPDRVASGHDGMPELSIYTGDVPYSYWFSAFCPNCRRGSKLQSHRSAYFALLYWNDIQKSCWSTLCTDLAGNRKDGIEEWQWEIYKEWNPSAFDRLQKRAVAYREAHKGDKNAYAERALSFRLESNSAENKE